MKLVSYPDERLVKKSQPVEVNDKPREFVDEMRSFIAEELTWKRTLGLAAPQVGKNIRVFIALGEVYVNPEVLWIPQGGKIPGSEACFSLEDGHKEYSV